ncbi:MAG: sugar-binding protein [Planctomycetota bacterium]
MFAMFRLPLTACLLVCTMTASALEVPLAVTNRSKLPRDAELAAGGVPLPIGALKDASTLRVADSTGQPAPAQFTVLNRWPADGSIRWVLVQFPAKIAGEQTLKYTLTTGRAKPPAHPHRVRIAEQDGSYQVDTGVMRLAVKKKNFALFDRVVLLDGAKEIPVAGPAACGEGFTIETETRGAFSTANDADCTLRVEDAGPLRATIVAEGKHKNDKGEGLFDYQVRIYAVAGSRAVRVQYVFTNSEGEWPQERIDVRRASVTLSLKPKELDSRWLVDLKRRIEVGDADTPARLDASETRYYEGPAVAGLAFKDGGRVEATVRWFWQLRPKSLEVTKNSAVVGVIDAPKPKEAVHIYPGMSKTHDLMFRFAGPGESLDDANTCRHFQDPLFVKCEPGWYCQKTLSLGRLVSADYQGYKPEFKQVRKVIDDGFRKQVEVIRRLRKQVIDRERGMDSYHVIHFGDGFHHRKRGGTHRGIEWDNCYYSYTHLLAMQYCRTGDDVILDTLREAATFEGDIAVCWHKSHLGAPRVNPGAYHIAGFSGWRRFTSGTYNFYKPIGMLELFYLTGDRRHQEAGLTNLRWMLTHDGYNMLHNPRSCGAGSRAAVHGYLATGNQDYLYLARRMARYAIGMQETYGHFAPVRNSIFMAPNALEGLCVYHELTGDERLGKMLPVMVKADFKHFRRPQSLTVGFMNFYVAHLAGDEEHLATISKGMAGRRGFGIQRGNHAVKDFAAGKRPVPRMMWYLTDLAKKPAPWAGEIELDPFPDDTADCPRIAAPKLDGSLGDWGEATAVPLVGLPNPRRELHAATRVRVGHDLKNLYIGIEAAEPVMDELQTTVTKPDGPVYQDDCVEIYVGPVPRRHCLKLIVNAAGVAATRTRGFDKGKYNEPKPADIRTAAGKSKDGWTLEIAVPLDKLGLQGEPKAGTKLGFNVIRFRRPERFEMSTWIGSINEAHSTGTLVLR